MQATLSERLRSGDLLEPKLVTFTAALLLAGTIFGIGFLLLTAKGNLDLMDRPLGTDFSSFWTAGRMALDGHAAAAYDWAALEKEQTRLLGSREFFSFSYPPIFLLLTSLLALLPYLPSLALWQAASGAAAAAVVWNIMPTRRALLLAAAFPAVLLCIGHGQNGFLTAALLGGGLLFLPRQEWLAGVCFGLVAYKPQFGLVVPVALVAGGYWRAVVAAAVTVAGTVGLSLVVWGWPVWQAFLDGLPLQRIHVLEMGAVGFHKFQSLFAWVRLIGGPVPLAYAAQALVSLAAIAVVAWAWQSQVSQRLKSATLLVAVLLSSPFVLDYDLVVLGMAIAFLAAHALERGFWPWEKSLLALAWFMPVAARGVTQISFVPIGFLTLACLFVLVTLRVQDERALLATGDMTRAA